MLFKKIREIDEWSDKYKKLEIHLQEKITQESLI